MTRNLAEPDWMTRNLAEPDWMTLSQVVATFSPMADQRTSPHVLGRRGEQLAAAVYEQDGWTVLDRNWRCEQGELDLVVQRDDITAFCEVKTRSSARYGLPAEAVDRRKQLRLRRIAAAWLQQNPGHRRVRFDVASVMGGRVQVIPEAF